MDRIACSSVVYLKNSLSIGIKNLVFSLLPHRQYVCILIYLDIKPNDLSKYIDLWFAPDQY